MSDAVYYERPVLLDRDKHRMLRVKPTSSFAFARKANSLYLAGVEFNEACKEYAIVFTRGAHQKIMPVAMLGLRSRENLFVDPSERWTGTYVPAFVRRYPFVLAELPGQGLGACIDEAYGGLDDKEGEALFDAKGGNTPFLQNALDFLTRLPAGVRPHRQLLPAPGAGRTADGDECQGPAGGRAQLRSQWPAGRR